METGTHQKAVLNIELPKQGVSFAVPHTKVTFEPKLLRQLRQWRFMSDTERLFFDIDATVKRATIVGDTAMGATHFSSTLFYRYFTPTACCSMILLFHLLSLLHLYRGIFKTIKFCIL